MRAMPSALVTLLFAAAPLVADPPENILAKRFLPL